MKKIGNAYGVAGLQGNIFAESGCKAMNVQNSFEKKLGMDDEAYTLAVDMGAYGNFVRDGAGYGIAQWTSGCGQFLDLMSKDVRRKK